MGRTTLSRNGRNLRPLPRETERSSPLFDCKHNDYTGSITHETRVTLPTNEQSGINRMAKMSKAHKDAMAKGRRQARAVKAYLEGLEVGRRRGPKMTPEKLRTRVEETEQAIDEADSPIKRLELIQTRMDLQEHLEELEAQVDVSELEDEFVGVAAEYGERKGIAYMAWRELGVPAAVLRRAGITRAS